jgi:DNA-binding MarR family transcriptional regulator
MSIQAVAWALKQRTGSPTLKVTLLAVANYADEEGKCWPSQERLALDTDLSERSVRDALKRLQEMGYLSREARRINGNQRETDIIRLNSHRKILPVETPPENDDTATGKLRQKPPEAPAGKPLVEPSKNHHSSLRSEPAREQNLTSGNVVRLKQKTRLTEAFVLTDQRLAKGLEKGLSEEETCHEFGKFQDHFIGNGVAWVDWDRCWSKWLSTALERGTRQAAYGSGRQAPATFFHATKRAIARVQAARGDDGGYEVDLPF